MDMNNKPENKLVRVLLSGFGLIGSVHAKLIADNPKTDLVAVVVPDIEEYKEQVSKYNANIYATIDEALDNEKIDAAIISSPNEFHFEQSKILIKQCIPVLVEKPLTDNLMDAKRLVESSAEYNVPVLVGHHRTYSPLLSVAKDFIASEKFGRMVAVQGSALFYKPAHYFIDGPWRTKQGGGPILINLIHEIGILRHFCGEIKRVSAFESKHARGYEVEDTVVINFEFDTGVLANFLLSDVAASNKSWEMTSGENPSYPHHPSDACYHFAGTNGSLDFPSMNIRFYNDSSKASWWSEFEEGTLPFVPEDPLKCQLEHFYNVISGKAKPLVTVEDGYINMLVIEAIKQSILSDKSIDINTIKV